MPLHWNVSDNILCTLNSQGGRRPNQRQNVSNSPNSISIRCLKVRGVRIGTKSLAQVQRQYLNGSSYQKQKMTVTSLYIRITDHQTILNGFVAIVTARRHVIEIFYSCNITRVIGTPKISVSVVQTCCLCFNCNDLSTSREIFAW